ncbi:MAG TPA: pyridoxamine 5'-phosphate oxidase family protein [Jatrophihabitantaceae bacterium]|nr:pyridoxamine 5'-phosphate oxidase family protein [Jatrophihabitantaceae bacterium]
MTTSQGSIELLDTPVAQRLLASTEYARLAYIGKDGMPRLIPMLFHWNGTEIVLPTFANSAKLRALRENPAVAITIDAAGPPPQVLQLRGHADIDMQDGVVDEYELAHRRYYGDEQGRANVAPLREAGVAQARIVLRPDWVGVIDFETRVPRAMAEAMS